jgi:hypothetical protein
VKGNVDCGVVDDASEGLFGELLSVKGDPCCVGFPNRFEGVVGFVLLSVVRLKGFEKA